jgi:hypothetical protein
MAADARPQYKWVSGLHRAMQARIADELKAECEIQAGLTPELSVLLTKLQGAEDRQENRC